MRTAAETFVPNPKLDVAEVISQMGVGEALVSTLADKGIPTPVERAMICPPRCRMGAITPEERAMVRGRSPVGLKYDTAVNRESAYELLARKAEATAAAQPTAAQGRPSTVAPSTPAPSHVPPPAASSGAGSGVFGGAISDMLFGTGRRQGMVEAMAKSAARTVGSQVGRQILRGVLGGILGGSRR